MSIPMTKTYVESVINEYERQQSEIRPLMKKVKNGATLGVWGLEPGEYIPVTLVDVLSEEVGLISYKYSDGKIDTDYVTSMYVN